MKHSYFDTEAWQKEVFLALDPNAKLLFLYIRTNPLNNIAGIYPNTTRRMAFDTGLSPEVIETALREFEGKKLISRIGEYVIILDWPNSQNLESMQIRKGIERIISQLPIDIIETLKSIGYAYDMKFIDSNQLILSKINAQAEVKKSLLAKASNAENSEESNIPSADVHGDDCNQRDPTMSPVASFGDSSRSADINDSDSDSEPKLSNAAYINALLKGSKMEAFHNFCLDLAKRRHADYPEAMAKKLETEPDVAKKYLALQHYTEAGGVSGRPDAWTEEDLAKWQRDCNDALRVPPSAFRDFLNNACKEEPDSSIAEIIKIIG